jgi:hypothetical protein
MQIKKLIIRQLLKNLLLTFVISFVLTTISILLFYNKQMGSLEGNSGVTLFIIGGFLLSLTMTILSTTVFLNIYDAFRNDKLRCFLTFFLLPILLTLIIYLSNKDFDMLPLYLILTMPFLLTQSYFYRQFIKTLTRLNLEEKHSTQH